MADGAARHAKLTARLPNSPSISTKSLKAYAGTHSCALPHVAMVLQGTLRVVMDDGSKEDFSAGEMMLLPPGHDAWCVGKTACIFVEFSQGNNYYNKLVKEWHHQNA